MRQYSFHSLILLLLIITSCKKGSNKSSTIGQQPVNEEVTADSLESVRSDFDEKLWSEITEEDSGIILDIRYATSDNFTKEVIYECGRCFLRPELAAKLKNLNKGIMERYQLRIKVFDCYRPLPAQQKLWDIVPNASYVTPPQKGSMHNKGLAVDLTLTDMEGNPLDMGTPYDHFGKEAHIDNLGLPETVISNRNILKTMMEAIGLKGIRTEWWHYSYQEISYELSSWQWQCL